MNEVETALTTMFVERAQGVVPERGHRERTLRRAKRRRVVNTAAAGLACVALAAGAFGAVRALDAAPDAVAPAGPDRSGKTTATAGEFGFWSTTDTEYPFVATGFFRKGDWRLRAAAVRLAPDANVRLSFDIRGTANGSLWTSTEVVPAGDPLVVQYGYMSWRGDGSVATVHGAAPPRTDAVEITMRDGTLVEAHVFRGYDNKTGRDYAYYLAFVPSEMRGTVVASSAGRSIAQEVIPQR